MTYRMTHHTYIESMLSVDILFALNYHAKHITPSQRIDLSNALAALVGSLGDDPNQRIGSLSVVAPVAPQRGRAAYKPRPTKPDIQHTQLHNPFTVPNDAPKHIALIAN